jgi:hypothetical protein
MTPWSKVLLGWADPVFVDTADVRSFELMPSQRCPDIVVVTNGFPTDEFLVVENRARVGFDSEAAAAGVVV